MNREHFQAFVWLRWRLRRNQFKQDGILGAVVVIIAAVLVAAAAVMLFVGLFLASWFGMKDLPPAAVMYVWDGLVFGFLVFWLVGLLTDLQRSDALSLDKFLHLPVSLSSAFVINYLSSMVCVSLVLFLAGAVGFSLGLCLGNGPAMLLLLPLTFAFLLMVTALTHQFQSWLASLMANKRRRRNVMVVVTMVVVLFSQAPNLIFNVVGVGRAAPEIDQEWQTQRVELERRHAEHEMTDEQYKEDSDKLQKEHQARIGERNDRTVQQWERGIALANLVLPAGWLPLGAMAAAEGRGLLALLAVLGLTLIGTLSLWRSYRTTLRIYTGYYTAGQGRPAPRPAATAADRTRVPLVERKLPGFSEPVSAVALGTLTSLMRMPEVKMLLVVPLLMILFGWIFLTRVPAKPPEFTRPFMAAGAMVMTLFSLGNLFINLFGLDRSGFRAIVLAPASRRDVLLGKNLATAPLALGMASILALALQFVFPSSLEGLLTLPFVFVSMYLLYCLMGNLLSIWVPLTMGVGTFKPVKVSGKAILCQLAFMFVMPMVLAPTLLPLGIAAALAATQTLPGWPIGLAVAIVECAAVTFLYAKALDGEGRLLQAREQKILEVVAVKDE